MFSPIKLINNTGLKSEKNLCFVNTALQLLYCIPRVRVLFKSKEYRLPSECGKKMKICDEIARLFNSEINCNLSTAELRHLVSIASERLYLHNSSVIRVSPDHKTIQLWCMWCIWCRTVVGGLIK